MTPEEQEKQENAESIEYLLDVSKNNDFFGLIKKLSSESKIFSYMVDSINRGVEQNQYTAEARDQALQHNPDIWYMYAFQMVKKGDSYKKWKPVLEKGIQSGLYLQSDIKEVIKKDFLSEYLETMAKLPEKRYF